MIGKTLKELHYSGEYPPSFDDVMLVPSYSDIRSRRVPETRTVVGRNIALDCPVISSPMDTVTGPDMAHAMSYNGAAGIIHRFATKEQQAIMLQDTIDLHRESYERNPLDKRRLQLIPAIGVGDAEKERFSYLYSKFEGHLTGVAIDIANGDSSYMEEMVSWVRSNVGYIPIIAGNVATGDGFIRLAEAGANAIRVGIGGGSICKTRIMTGVGVPTLASVIDCYLKREGTSHQGVSIIADGGIRYPADLVKSLAAGADAVIAGRIFAGTIESPGEVISINGAKVKTYRGMASKEVQEDKRGGMRPGTCAEGVSTYIPMKGKAHYIITEFCGGLRSAMTYLNARNLADLRDNARFIRVTSSALDESHAFGTRK